MVKRFFMAALVVILLLAVLTSGMGCDLFEDMDCEASNYINVAVSATIHAQVTEIEPYNTTEPWAGAQLQVEISKSGGERVTCNGTTNAYGDLPEQCQGTFKVYREQYVKIVIHPISGVFPASMGGEIYNPDQHVMVANTHTLNWNAIEDVGWGETYYWSPTITLAMRKE